MEGMGGLSRTITLSDDKDNPNAIAEVTISLHDNEPLHKGSGSMLIARLVKGASRWLAKDEGTWSDNALEIRRITWRDGRHGLLILTGKPNPLLEDKK